MQLSLCYRSLYTFDNGTGPDEANRDWHGIFIMNEAGCRRGGEASRGITRGCVPVTSGQPRLTCSDYPLTLRPGGGASRPHREAWPREQAVMAAEC
jgi:hypothetical protein